ncbi:hypothetical protein E1265_35285 [Streptomyces sp. 8K308]|uniref:hypothetical protein n=1 Tax=Streptomyces sp. 8K308 TaxID=2530388 RepID=UPI001048E15B|nr:hypothetical protein [Streptomyces sp. 8K308]TDC05690.1 hypothetical protein E1265_35285 [Streptomyces sp. 8K308]
MADPTVIRARRAIAVASRVIAVVGVRAPVAIRALRAAHHAVAAALDRGHRVADIHRPLRQETKT